ncbi:MAG TPA: 50S ribosomal protein L9 [Candidatus Cryosericum sp.]|nr:50S ribosomal protein L9 [Candidatus Cryosericum sp.]
MDRKVILLADVKGVGHKNDVVNVSVGYAANYLLPQGLAVDATPQRLAGLAKRKVAQSQEKDAALARAREIAAKLGGQTVTVHAKATPQGRLYGAITPEEVVAALAKQLGVAVEKKTVSIDEPIKALGVYQVSLRLNPEVIVPLAVTVAEAV